MATATIIGSSSSAGAVKTGLTSASESQLYLDPEQLRQTEYKVYLHTISKRDFLQPNSIYRNVRVPKCPDGKRSIMFMAVQHPVQSPHLNPDNVNGPPLLRFENAKRVALGIVNPDYAGTDLSIQDKDLDPETVLSSGECNLGRQGVFASMNEVPTEAEIVKAEKRREAYYRFRLQEADGLERSNPRQLQHILMLDHHMAADFFGIEANWHRAPSAKVDCPNCGQKIPTGVAFHYDNGRICVLNWEKAWLAGAVKKDDVPEPLRWWTDKPQADVEQLRQDAESLGIKVDLRWSAETLAAKIQDALKA